MSFLNKYGLFLLLVVATPMYTAVKSIKQHMLISFCYLLIAQQILPFQSCNGYIQLYHNWGWSVLSYNGFDMNAGNVACRQMGCGPAISHSGYYSGSTLLPDLSCSGSEFSLMECQHSNSWTYQYGYYAHVDCSGMAQFLCTFHNLLLISS